MGYRCCVGFYFRKGFSPRFVALQELTSGNLCPAEVVRRTISVTSRSSPKLACEVSERLYAFSSIFFNLEYG